MAKLLEALSFLWQKGWGILEQVELLNLFQSHSCENYLFGTLY